MTEPVKLPAAPWHQRDSLKAVIKALGGSGETRYVGGAVRDTLLGLPVKDVDLATILKPDEVMVRLEVAKIKVIPTGIDHGTVTAVTDDGPVEITTLRRDVSTDGRRATVAFSNDWREDAARRDFTINALFADPESWEVLDYFDGLKDLETRRIRFIGSAQERIAEDHLRIMRYFRFLARFGQNQVDQDAFDACRGAARELEKLSRERIADELMKLLATDDPRYAIEQMIAADVFTHIVDEIDPDALQLLARLILRERKHGIAPDPVRRLVALLPKDAAQAVAIANSLRMSNKMRKAIAAILSVNPTLQTIRACAYYTSPETARDHALLFGTEDNVAAMLTNLIDWQPPTLPLTGGDLIAMGLEPGPAVSKALAKVERQWVAEDFPDAERIKEIAKAVLRT